MACTRGPHRSTLPPALAEKRDLGEILVTEAVRDQVASADPGPAAQLIARGSYELRNVSQPLELFGLVRDDDYHTDPVCRMRVREDESAGQLTVEGVVYHFCSLDCVRSCVEKLEREQA